MGDRILNRLAIHLTWKCTLRCEKCGAFIPESYEKKLDYDYDYDEIIQSLTTIFAITDTINVITLTGGEAILHRNIVELCEFLLENENKFNRLDFQTNGTIPFSEKLLKVMAKSNKFNLFIDHYGPDISTNVEQNTLICTKLGVKYQVRKYYGEDAHMNGWIDWSPRKEKIDMETAKKQFLKCANGHPTKRPFVLYGTKLTLCAMPFCRYRVGWQPLEDILMLDLADERLSLKEKEIRLLEMHNTEFNPGCQYCYGLGVDPNAERFQAGKQIENNHYVNIVKLINQISPYVEINKNTQLLDEGILDSMAILGFITLLEDEFEIEIPDDEIKRENFESIKSISTLIRNLKIKSEKNDN
jgi:acyl carrier protein/organic radical activating enzyme